VSDPKTIAPGQTQAKYDSLLQAIGMPSEPVREPGCDGCCGDPRYEVAQRINLMLQDVNLEAEDFLTAISQNPDGFIGWLASTTGRAH